MAENTQSDSDDYNIRDYEKRWRGYLENTHEKLLEELLKDLDEEDSLLDVSCGTGLLESRLLDHDAPFRELVLNDIEPRMLGYARRRLPDNSRMSYSSHSAERLHFESNRFTRVICLNALHKYDNPSAAVRQFKDVLTPDGKLYLLDWNRSGWFRPLNTLIRWYDDKPVNSMSLSEAEQMLREHRFRIEKAEQWRYRYWKLYLVVGGFQYWKDY